LFQVVFAKSNNTIYRGRVVICTIPITTASGVIEVKTIKRMQAVT
jgi:hypothetical protein